MRKGSQIKKTRQLDWIDNFYTSLVALAEKFPTKKKGYYAPFDKNRGCSRR